MVAQTESTPTPIYAKVKEWLAFASVIVVVAGGIPAGLLGGMKLVIAPLQTDVRAIHGRLDRMDGHIRGFEHATQNELKAVRVDISALSERLVRVETLLEQVIRQPNTPQ